MQNQINNHNASLLFQAMRIQDAATKAEFAQQALNSFIHCGAESLLEKPLDVAVLQQAREILKKLNTRDAFDKLVEETV